MDNLSEDIINYKKGKLSPSQMHALEKRALDDPFLADALEGIANVSDEELAHDISVINEKIGRKKNTILFTPLRLAAGLVLLISSVLIIYQLIPKPQRIALKGESEEQKVESRKRKAESEGPKAESGKQKAEREKEEVVSKSSEPKSVAAGINQPAPAPALASAEELHEATADINQSNDKVEEKPKEVDNASGAAAGAQPTSVDRNKKSLAQNDARRSAPLSLKASATRLISGQVVSANDGTPIPGATVVVSETSTPTMTDLKGNYSIPVTADKGDLTFSFSGLKETKVDLPTVDHLDVQMKDDSSQLSVILVTSTEVRTTKNSAAAIHLAEPDGGKKKYDDYLKTNLRYPQEARSKNTRGYARVAFVVNEDGGLVDFKVVKKLGHGCDEEIIRLVKDGPKWNATAENGVPVKSRVQLQVQFDPALLPK